MPQFDPSCRDCPRLAEFLDQCSDRFPDYHNRPVPAFGDPKAQLLIVGLAPGMHGANCTGRPFTGDHAGILLYQTLFDHGFSNQATSDSAEDALVLKQARISNAVKCLPPENKPVGSEIRQCNAYLASEFEESPDLKVLLALGSIAHRAVLMAYGIKQSAHKFGHAAEHELPDGRILLDSYHCSRYNTQTRRLTPEMFSNVFWRARQILNDCAD